ncbi:MAG: hypothetical protein NZ583_04680 [Desulfobacterota bacterium]|nr:hypothetical protein [Thermodesulfobacteriota bacterium]MDW8001435.1 hypothetical protein [Deltaproteobacteria bacterium]
MKVLSFIPLLIVLAICFENPVFATEKIQLPKEYGVYVKTPKKLVRLMPNIVFDEEGIYYIESLSPPRFLLKDVEYFIIYGEYNIDVLTLNPMQLFKTTIFGKQRYMFGPDIPIEVKEMREKMYTVKVKGLLGRGYFSLWIDDSAWDFIVE